MENDKKAYVLDYFELSGDEPGEVGVNCPFHDDKNASASINPERGMFHCWGCGEAGPLSKFADRLGFGGETVVVKEPDVIPDIKDYSTTLDGLAAEEFSRRGLDLESLPVSLSVEDRPGEKLNGYLVFQMRDSETYVARNLVTNENPRYLNNSGQKTVFFLDDYDTAADHVWIVEGMFDALALHTVGVKQVVAALGSDPHERALFPLRNKTVFVLYDSDYNGWVGARKTVEKLRKLGGSAVLVELPEALGKDPGEAYEKRPHEFSAWIEKQIADISHDDRGYVNTVLEGRETLQVIPTGIKTLDTYLGGGYKDGVHLIGAVPGIGKSALVAYLAVQAATQGKRTLIVSYEISKLQYWSRVWSTFSAYEWDHLEMFPDLIRQEGLRERAVALASMIVVKTGWPISKIQHAMRDYDALALDYVQRMPGLVGERDSKVNVSGNIRAVSDLARDEGKVIYAISSLNRTGYDNLSMAVFKDTGDLEYVAQTATVLRKGPKEGIVEGVLIKNTRGVNGAGFWLYPDLGHCRFTEDEGDYLRRKDSDDSEKAHQRHQAISEAFS